MTDVYYRVRCKKCGIAEHVVGPGQKMARPCGIESDWKLILPGRPFPHVISQCEMDVARVGYEWNRPWKKLGPAVPPQFDDAEQHWTG